MCPRSLDTGHSGKQLNHLHQDWDNSFVFWPKQLMFCGSTMGGIPSMATSLLKLNVTLKRWYFIKITLFFYLFFSRLFMLHLKFSKKKKRKEKETIFTNQIMQNNPSNSALLGTTGKPWMTTLTPPVTGQRFSKKSTERQEMKPVSRRGRWDIVCLYRLQKCKIFQYQ